MADEGRKRYNELRFLLRKIEDVADEAAEVVEGHDLPGVEAALETIALGAAALRSNLTPEDFEVDDAED